MRRTAKAAVVLLALAGAGLWALFRVEQPTSSVAVRASVAKEESKAERASLLFVLIDTLRADHLGSYGYDRETSPEMDRLAAEGIRFSDVYSVCNWTNPTIKSLFTGRYPQAVMRPALHKEAIKIALPQEVQTFAELARENGYATVGLVDHPGISPKLGFDQGFDGYQMMWREGAEDRGARGKSNVDYVLAQTARALDGFGDKPFLLYTSSTRIDRMPGRLPTAACSDPMGSTGTGGPTGKP